MSTCRQIHIVSLPYSKTRPGLDAHITKRTAILLLLDIVATYAAYWLASLLTDVEGEVFVNNEIYFMLGILALINVAVLGLFHLYNNLWEYASVDEAIQIVLAVVLSTLVGAVFLWIIDVRLPIRVFFVSCFMLIFFMGGIRLIFRVMRQKRRALVSTQRACDRPRTLVVGAGETGSLAIGRMASKDPLMPGIPIVATDDDPTKRGSRIHGVRVAGSTDDIVDLVDKHNIDQIVVAIPSSTPEERKRIYGECTKTDCKLRTLPNVRELSLDEIGDVRLRDVDVADLLGREEIILNTRAVSGYIAGETVLVTGGGGSIGSELCRQLCKVAPARIVIFDMYENDAYMLRNELLAEYDDIDLVIEIGNVCDGAPERGVREVPPRRRVPRGRPQARAPHGAMPARGAAQQRVRHAQRRARRRRLRRRALHLHLHRQGREPHQRHGRHEAHGRDGHAVLRAHVEDHFLRRALRQRAGLERQRHPRVPAPDRRGRPPHRHPSRHRALLHDHPRGVAPGHPSRRHGEGRRDLHSRHGRAGEDRRLGEGPSSSCRASRPTWTSNRVTGLREGEKMYEELLMDEESTLPTDNHSILISTGQEISYTEVAEKLDELEAALTLTDEEAVHVLEKTVCTYRHTPNKVS